MKTHLLSILLLAPALSAAEPSKAPEEKDMAAYLLVHFNDDDHDLHFALSSDGYSFTSVNGGKPVMKGEDLAEQKGIRDPYIMRGPDNVFYLAMTDLHIFAQREGLRETEWQREGGEFGWGNNRGLVLMRSRDLIDWDHSRLRVDQAFPDLGGIGCAWAPEMIWDPERGRIMLYYTMRFGTEQNRLYYSYMNPDFTRMETRPKVLFEYPGGKTAIDGDITRVGDRYHLFYVPHDGTPGIKQATSEKINGDWVYDPAYCDPEKEACEAPNLWKRIGEDKWVLMYDCYGIETHNFGFTETSDFETFTPIGRFNEGPMKATNFTSPKHGAVIHLTEREARRLADHWKLEDF